MRVGQVVLAGRAGRAAGSVELGDQPAPSSGYVVRRRQRFLDNGVDVSVVNVMARYLYDPTTGLWISYDDPQSIRAKGAFITEHGLGGAMVWEVTSDRDQVLFDALRDSLA
ncbi:MAG: glycosyl hydrolase family 18 protein [Candidatus Nanopelagicales bacterium]